MSSIWIILGLLIILFFYARKRSRKKVLKSKSENKSEIPHVENPRAPSQLVEKEDNDEKIIPASEVEILNEISTYSPVPTIKAPPKIGPSYNDIIDEKQKQKKLKQDALIDPLSGISLEKIETTLHGLRALIGKEKFKSSFDNQEYEVDMGQQTCTCEIFSKKENFPINDARRFCHHMVGVFELRDAFSRVDHRTRMVADLGSVSPVMVAYALQHMELPLMYLFVEDENPWLSLYGRDKKTGETIYNASGDFIRHGYNILEHRWAYGSGVVGASFLNPFLKSINSLEDIDEAISEISKRPQRQTLTRKADPRLNPNYGSDQYGPLFDAYDIPESALTYEHPCECSLLFSYVDGRGGQSRRTVDFKKLQFYGNEGAFLYGKCRMRREGRTFDIQKMTDVIDITTGEVVENVIEYSENFWKESAKAKLLDWADNYDRLAKAFLFLLKGNKRPSKVDYVALSMIFSDMLDGAKVTTQDIQFLYADLEPTTAVGFQRLVGGIIKHHSDQVAWFKQNALRLVEARAKPNFADQAAIQYLNSRVP